MRAPVIGGAGLLLFLNGLPKSFRKDFGGRAQGAGFGCTEFCVLRGRGWLVVHHVPNGRVHGVDRFQSHESSLRAPWYGRQKNDRTVSP